MKNASLSAVPPMFGVLVLALVATLGSFARPADAHAAASFELHFRCSPWLYLSQIDHTDRERFFWTGEIRMDIAAVNASLCTQNAQRMTYAANTVFALNGIPATFTYTTEVLPGGGLVVSGQRYRHTGFGYPARDAATDEINARNAFPDITVKDVDVHVGVDTSTCNPWDAGSAACSSATVASCPASNSPYSLCRNAAGGSIYATISPFITDYEARFILTTDLWSASSAVSGPRRINVSVRAVPDPGGKALGAAHGLYDRSSTALDINYEPLVKRALTPNNYLPTLGIVTVNAGPASLFNITALVHELGHVFGALHERGAEPSPFEELAGIMASGYQFANLASAAPAGYISYDTLMVGGLTENGRLSFSTPVKWKGGPVLCAVGKTCPKTAHSIGDAITDNRRYVFETIQWISGDASLLLAAPTHPTDNTLSKVLP